MKSSFYRKFYGQTVKWSASLLSCATMIFSPVAMGKEAEKNSQAYIQAAVQEFGLDKKTTLGQFWDNSKAYVPGYMYQELKEYVAQNKNTLMPEVTVSSAKSSTGEMIPVLKVTKNGKTDTIQIFGEKNKWAKINGVTFTEEDFKNPEMAIFKYSRSDFKLRKELEKFEQDQDQDQEAKSAPKGSAVVEGYKKDFARFKGFPRITPQMWTSLTPKQRAGYIVKMRLLWTDARRVLQNAREQGEPTQKNKKSAAIENFLKVILGQDASAQTSPVLDVGNTKKESLDGEGGVIGGPVDVNAQKGQPKPVAKPGVMPVKRLPDGTVAVSGSASPDGSKPDSASAGSQSANSQSTGSPSASVSSATGAKRGDTVKSNVGFSGSCIVAGYVSEYATGRNVNGVGRLCNVSAKADGYKSVSYVVDANKKCLELKGSEKLNGVPNVKGQPQYRWAACNPITYSYQDDGSPICFDRLSKVGQQLTHFNALPDNEIGCDEASRLSEGDTAPFDPKVVTDRNEQIKLIEKSQKEQDYKLTEKFLANMLKAKDPALERLFAGRASMNNEWTEDMQKLDAELLQIQKNFETEINQAIEICKADKGSYSKNQERNQPGACDQLQRRWLFTEKFIAEIRQKGCLDGSVYIGSYKKEDFITGNDVTKYNKEQTYKTEPVSGDSAGSGSPSSSIPGTKRVDVNLCKCSGGEMVALAENCPIVVIGQPSELPSQQPEQCKLSGNHVDKVNCKCEKGYKVDKKTNTCVKKSNKAWLFAIPILGVLALLAFKGGKKKDPPTTPPNCPANKQLVGGICMCPATTPTCPADLRNEETCACTVQPPPPVCSGPKCGCPTEPCSLTPDGKPQIRGADCQCRPVELCPDLVTPVSQGCPVPPTCQDGKPKPADGICKKRCDDGSSVPEDQSCPVPPSEGGQGDPDPDGNGYSGV